MARRGHREEEQENHERWLVSYADFITLLFAFFVVMYAISSVNQGKYRVLSDSLTSAFRDIPAEMSGAMVTINDARRGKDASQNGQPGMHERAVRQREQIAAMARQIEGALGSLAKDGRAHVSDGAFGLTIDINASLLFASGDARLNAAAAPVLEEIARVLAASAFPIVVEGHTDNMPISSATFPSNWELSGMRAASVVRVFGESGVAAARLSAVGYADQRPLADNATAAGRQRNRRVAITIVLPGEGRPNGVLAPQ